MRSGAASGSERALQTDAQKEPLLPPPGPGGWGWGGTRRVVEAKIEFSHYVLASSGTEAPGPWIPLLKGGGIDSIQGEADGPFSPLPPPPPPASPDASLTPPPLHKVDQLVPICERRGASASRLVRVRTVLGPDSSPPPPPLALGEGRGRGEGKAGGGRRRRGVTQYSSGTFSTGRPLRCCSQKRREQTHSLRACSSSTRYARACFSPSAVHLSSRSENRPRDLGKTGG